MYPCPEENRYAKEFKDAVPCHTVPAQPNNWSGSRGGSDGAWDGDGIGNGGVTSGASDPVSGCQAIQQYSDVIARLVSRDLGTFIMQVLT